MDFSELWCLATVDGGECRETFDTYDDFEEHFCQKHLDLVLFACGARGCTAQFGTVLQIFRHLAICKRRGKKIKLLQCSDSALESLTVLDRAKLLAVQCCVRRAKRANELTRAIGDITAKRIRESNVQCSSSIESGSNRVKRERAVTPARQAARRLKEQMLLDQKMKTKNKLLEKAAKDTQMKQKKVPVKITDKNRISALINDDPKTMRTSSYPQTVESGLLRNPALGNVNSNTLIESTKYIMCTESRPKLLFDKIQDPISAIQKQPRVFESSLPAGPNNPPKTDDVLRPQSSSLGLTVTRPPDYSGFLRNSVRNPTLNEISPFVSAIAPLQTSSVQASNSHQNNFETNLTLTKTTPVSQPVMFTDEVYKRQKSCDTKLRKILKTKKRRFQNAIEPIEQSGQVDINVLSLFSKKMKECKTLERIEVSSLRAEQLEQPTGQSKSIKSNVVLGKEISAVEQPKWFESNENLDLSCDRDCGENDNEPIGSVPTLLNLFSDQETAAPVLYDPRVIPGLPNADKSRSDGQNVGEKLLRKKEWKCGETLITIAQEEVRRNESFIDVRILDRDRENHIHRNISIVNYNEEVKTEVPVDHRTGRRKC